MFASRGRIGVATMLKVIARVDGTDTCCSVTLDADLASITAGTVAGAAMATVDV